VKISIKSECYPTQRESATDHDFAVELTTLNNEFDGTSAEDLHIPRELKVLNALLLRVSGCGSGRVPPASSA